MEVVMQLGLTIDGMSCGHCVGRVRQALEAVPGIRIDALTIGSATVSYDPDRTSPAAIACAVTNAGYETRPAA
jgi:copper chaperone CopZ